MGIKSVNVLEVCYKLNNNMIINIHSIINNKINKIHNAIILYNIYLHCTIYTKIKYILLHIILYIIIIYPIYLENYIFIIWLIYESKLL